ncbi:MAG: DNA repair protein RecO [Rickettsiales bacterium]|nr:DNA repair protein RecO [Rickettsiales bacterium]
MQWNDTALILSISKFSEHDAVVRVLSREHGLYSGIAKRGLGKSKRGIYQPGNLVHAEWKARLEQHMGSFDCELAKPFAALLMKHPHKLAGLNAACSMIPLAMEERDPHAQLYDAFMHVISQMIGGDEWISDYIRFEMTLLREAGYGLDLSRCVATGAQEDLVYVSPKSGCAVSEAAGRPYHERMLKLPRFLREEVKPVEDEIHEAFRLTSHFLSSWLLEPLGKRMPQARERLLQVVS